MLNLETADLLAESLKNMEPGVRKWAADALGEMGTEARRVFPAVFEATKDEDEEVRQAAAEAVKKIEPDEPQPAAK